MKVLELIAHADPTGVSSAHVLARATQEALTAAGNEVQVVDLVKEHFTDPASTADFVDKQEGKRFNYIALGMKQENLVPQIKEQQAKLHWADYILVFGPLWWYRLPGCFECYMDRVLTLGAAYKYGKPANEQPLYGKKLMYVITAGGEDSYYSHGGGATTMDALLYPMLQAFNFCGLTLLRTQAFCGVSATQPVAPDLVEKWKKAVLKLDKRPALNFTPQNGKDPVQLFSEQPNYSLDEAIAA